MQSESGVSTGDFDTAHWQLLSKEPVSGIAENGKALSTNMRVDQLSRYNKGRLISTVEPFDQIPVLLLYKM